eukprot:jgi/Botrbrau1/23043/Bobra.136_1s0032.1
MTSLRLSEMHYRSPSLGMQRMLCIRSRDGTRRSHVGITLIATAVAHLLASVQAAPNQVFQGTALVYGGYQDNKDPQQPSFGVLEGACGYGEMKKDSWPYWQAVSLSFSSPILLDRSLPRWACGVCLTITCYDKACPAGTPPLTAVVTDTCTGCGPSDLSLQALAFGKLADTGFGRLNVSYQVVDCLPPGNVVIKAMDGRASEGGYLKVVNTQVAGDAVISDMKVRQQGSPDWTQGVNGWGATWEFNKFGIPEVAHPLDILITGEPGTPPVLLSGLIPSLEPGILYPTNFQVGRVGAPSPKGSRPLLSTAMAPLSAGLPGGAPAPSRPHSLAGGVAPSGAFLLGALAPEGIVSVLGPSVASGLPQAPVGAMPLVPSQGPAGAAPPPQSGLPLGAAGPALGPSGGLPGALEAAALAPGGSFGVPGPAPVEGVATSEPLGPSLGLPPVALGLVPAQAPTKLTPSLAPTAAPATQLTGGGGGSGNAHPAVSLELRGANFGGPTYQQAVQRVVNSGDQHVTVVSAGK